MIVLNAGDLASAQTAGAGDLTEIERLRLEVEKLIGKPVALNIVEVKSPDVDAQLVAENIAQQPQGLGQDLTLVDPNLHANAAVSGGSLGEAVVDVGTDGLQGGRTSWWATCWWRIRRSVST